MIIQWLKFRKNLKGRDPLGVQAIGIHLYGLLVPGITNVTQRLRYYSFYPWILKLYKDEKISLDFVSFLRRSEFLFGLVTNFHHGNQDDWSSHAVGTNTMNKAIAELDKTVAIKLSKYTTTKETELRYFKNKLGGFGQYYQGQLPLLGILVHKGKNEYSLYPNGNKLAECFDAGNIENIFVSCVVNDEVSKQTLKDLHDYLCLRLISKNKTEYKILSEILFGADDFTEVHSLFRRKTTLALLFYLLEQINEPADFWQLLNILYYEVDKKGRSIVVPSRLHEITKLWKYYLRHEYFSIGLLAIFVGIQHVLDIDYYTHSQIASFCWNNFIECSDSRNSPKFLAKCHIKLKENLLLKDYIEWLKGDYNRKNVHDENSLTEFSIANFLIGRSYPPEKIIIGGLILIFLTIINEEAADDLHFPGLNLEPLLRQYPINLGTLRKDFIMKWRNLRVSNVLEDIILNYILRRHFEVAIRKLYIEGIATFRIFKEEGKYSHSGMDFDSVSRTSPRLTQSLQMLADLNIIKESSKRFFIEDEKIGREYFGELIYGS